MVDRTSRRKIEVERLTVTTSRPFDAVIAALRRQIGHPDMRVFFLASSRAQSFGDLKAIVQAAVGSTGLMLFMELDQGGVLRRESGQVGPKMVRLLVGNPLIMKEMAKHVPDAGSYVPVTILIDERPDGVHLSYDTMASLLAPYGSSDAVAVARELDAKIERLLREAAA